jgi:carbon storage regulator CsrA
MLVLTRKANQQIQIGANITITILRVKGQTIRVGIDAPRNVGVLRAELADKLAGNVDADSETVSAAKAAVERERQRAICGPEASTPAEPAATQTKLMRCRSPQVSSLSAHLGARSQHRLMAVASPVAIGS